MTERGKRTWEILASLAATWLKRGVRLVVITLQIDFNGEIGQMIAALLLHLAQMERSRLRE